MPSLLAPFVQETTTTTGTGTLALTAVPGKRTFVSAFGSGGKCFYLLMEDAAWEYGIGTVTDATPDTLSRDRVIASTQSGNKITLGSGFKAVFCDVPPVIGVNNGYGLFVNGDTTPSVKNGRVFRIQNTAPTSITAFDDGYPGQDILLWFANDNTTLLNGASIRLDAPSITPTGENIMRFVNFQSSGVDHWYKMSHSVPS